MASRATKPAHTLAPYEEVASDDNDSEDNTSDDEGEDVHDDNAGSLHQVTDVSIYQRPSMHRVRFRRRGHQPDDAGDSPRVCDQILDGLVVRAIEIHLHPGEQLAWIYEGNAASLEELANGVSHNLYNLCGQRADTRRVRAGRTYR